MIRNYFIVILLSLLVFDQAQAWEYNFSYTITDRQDVANYSGGDSGSVYGHSASECPITTHEVTCETCWDNSKNNGTQQRHNAKPKGHSCFKYSCYYQAFSFVKDAPTPVQPLTYDLDVVKTAIQGDETTSSIKDARSGITNEKLKAKINVGGYPWGNTFPEWARPYKIDVGAGTSAMQGLLWSWRSLSNNWQGVWDQRSEYEEDNRVASLRKDLPSGKNSKHIILISDGQDTDGIENYNFTNQVERYYKPNNLKPMRDLRETTRVNNEGFYKDDNGDYGFVFDERISIKKSYYSGYSINNPYKVEVPFDTCDAHLPQESIPLGYGKGISEDFGDRIDQEGYEEVCEAIAEQDIKVHSILYDYADNDRLEKCSEITGGLVMKDIEPAELEEALDEIFITIVKGKIRLTE